MGQTVGGYSDRADPGTTAAVGMQKVLCRLRWQKSAHANRRASPNLGIGEIGPNTWPLPNATQGDRRMPHG